MREDEPIAAYIDCSLDEVGATELQAWLRKDASNLRKFALATARNEQLRAVVEAKETLNAAQEHEAPRGVVQQPHSRKRAAAQCVLVACLLAFSWYYFLPRAGGDLKLTLVEMNGLVSLRTDDNTATQLNVGDSFRSGNLTVEGEGARAKLLNEDGTTFWLPGGSEITLVQDSHKSLFLRCGTLFANVSRQRADCPLLVGTADAEATVLGTSFALTVAHDETRLLVSSGAVKLRRLSDDQSLTVTARTLARARLNDNEPLQLENAPIVAATWAADPNGDATNGWVGTWSDQGVLMARPETVYRKMKGIHEVHYHAGTKNCFPGLVTLTEQSAVRIRYRIDHPINLGLFISTHKLSWEFSGNFQAYVSERETPPDQEGWRTAIVPIGQFMPMPRTPMTFQSGCVASTLFATTYADNVSLQAAELKVVESVNTGAETASEN